MANRPGATGGAPGRGRFDRDLYLCSGRGSSASEARQHGAGKDLGQYEPRWDVRPGPVNSGAFQRIHRREFAKQQNGRNRWEQTLTLALRNNGFRRRRIYLQLPRHARPDNRLTCDYNVLTGKVNRNDASLMVAPKFLPIEAWSEETDRGPVRRELSAGLMQVLISDHPTPPGSSQKGSRSVPSDCSLSWSVVSSATGGGWVLPQPPRLRGHDRHRRFGIALTAWMWGMMSAERTPTLNASARAASTAGRPSISAAPDLDDGPAACGARARGCRQDPGGMVERPKSPASNLSL